MQIIEGGVTAAKGFKAAGMAAGIKYKNGKKDMPLLLNGIRILYTMKLMHRQL